jgi:hypothetical protein
MGHANHRSQQERMMDKNQMAMKQAQNPEAVDFTEAR